MDLKSRISREPSGGDGFKWRPTLAWVALSLAFIGAWVFMLGSIAIREMTRGAVVLFEPSTKMLVGGSFLMLFGVVLLSIQVVAIVTHLVHGASPQRH